MYQVYTQQRPGRPRWALGASATLLLLTVGLAWGLIEHKNRLPSVSLEPFSSMGLKGGLPEKWTPIDLEKCPPGTVKAVAEPKEGQSPGRRLFIFHFGSYRGSSRSLSVAQIAKQLAILLAVPFAEKESLRATEPSPSQQDSIGDFPAQTVRVRGFSPQAGEVSVLVRMGVSKQSQLIGVALVSFDSRLPADSRLVDLVSKQLELTEGKPAADPAAIMAAAGISFAVPAGAIVLEKHDAGFPRVQLASSDAAAGWVLSLVRTPLIGSRSPGQIVRDALLDLADQPRLSAEAQPVLLGGREVFHAESVVSAESKVTLLGWCTEAAPGTALLVVGMMPEGDRKPLDDVCRAILNAIQVTPYQQLVDIPKAAAEARRRNTKLASEGMEAKWGGLEEERQVYEGGSGENRGDRDVFTYDRQRQDGQLWWQVRRRLFRQPESASRRVVVVEEVWRVQNKGQGSAYRFSRFSATGQRDINYEETREPASNQIKRTLKASGYEPREGSVTVDDTYATERVIVAAAGEMANDSGHEPAVFMTTEVFPEQAAYWILRPLGMSPVPWGAQGEKAAAVCLQRDFSPEPITLFFDTGGMLLGAIVDNSNWYHLTLKEEPVGKLP